MNDNIFDLQPMLTPKQAGKILNCSSTTVRRLCRGGRLRHLPLGSEYRISVDALKEFINKHTVSGLQLDRSQVYKPVRRTK